MLSRLVSVPLRGRGHEIEEAKALKVEAQEFPSPCGEEVMKWLNTVKLQRTI